MTAKVAMLDKYIAENVGYDLAEWPGGWPGEIEAALIDAIFSIRARYGSPNTGVRAVVNNWKKRSGRTVRADDLSVLANTEPSSFVDIVHNSSRASGRSKGEIVISAAKSLSAAGLVHANQFDGSSKQKSAYLSVIGCGPVTWSYLGMLLGQPGVKPDSWIVRFVSAALHEPVTSPEAGRLISMLASEKDLNPTQLDHAIWNFARRNL